MDIKKGLKTEIKLSSIFKRKPKNGEDIPMSGYDDAKAFTLKLPVVNIMPSSIAEKYANKDLMGSFKRLSVFLLLAFGAAQLLSFAYGGITNISIESAKSEAAAIQKDLAAYLPYKDYYDELQLKRSSAAQQLGSEIDFAKITSAVSKSASVAKVGIVKLNFAQGTCPSVKTEGKIAAIGCLTISGTGTSTGVDSFFSKLGKQSGFAESFISDIGGQGGIFNGSIIVTEDSYSKKFVDLKKTIDKLLEDKGIVISPNAKPSTATASPSASTSPKVGS